MTAPSHESDRFELVKWYLDAVEPDGSATIAYWASLAWLGLDITWHSVTRHALGQPPAERSSRRHVPPPECVDRRIVWRSPRLNLETMHEAAMPGVEVTLLDDERGRIVWECVAPSAHTRVTGDDGTSEGTGYVERLTMTVRPWNLPMDELRWGRWMSDDASEALVWIDWCGAQPQRWVVFDGAVHTDATVRDDGIGIGAGRLALGAPRTLHRRSVGKLLRGIVGLARVAANIPLAWEETKWCCRGTFTSAAQVSAEGWAIHEIVKFK